MARPKKIRSIEEEITKQEEAVAKSAYGHFPRPAGPHFPDSLGHIKRTAQ